MRPAEHFWCVSLMLGIRKRAASLRPKEVYGLVDSKFVPWSETAGFQSKTKDGRLIGPFNSVLFSPEMSSAFLAWQVAEEKHASLDQRVRQVVILAVGAVWKADYELYAHPAVARKAGLHDNTIAELAAGSPARDLTEAEQVAQRFTTELTASRRVDDALFNAAKEHFGLKGLVDLLSLIGAYQTVCGLLNGFAFRRQRVDRLCASTSTETMPCYLMPNYRSDSQSPHNFQCTSSWRTLLCVTTTPC